MLYEVITAGNHPGQQKIQGISGPRCRHQDPQDPGQKAGPEDQDSQQDQVDSEKAESGIPGGLKEGEGRIVAPGGKTGAQPEKGDKTKKIPDTVQHAQPSYNFV